MDQFKSSFGELLTVEPTSKINLGFAYGLNARENVIGVTGYAGVTGTDSLCVVSTGATGPSQAYMESKRIIHYHTGTGLSCRFTASFEGCTGPTGSAWIGLLDSTCGYALGFHNGQFSVLVRYDTGDETIIPATSFTPGLPNYRVKNEQGGYFPYFFDYTKLNVFQIQVQYLGGGAIEFYIENPRTGDFVLFHRVQYSGRHTKPSVKNPNLKLRIETDNKTSNDNMIVKTASMNASLEGRSVINIYPSFSASNAKLANAGGNIMTIKVKDAFKGFVNKSKIVLQSGSFSADGTKLVEVKLLENATITGGSWSDVDSNSVVSVNNTATISGGTPVMSFYIGKSESKIIDMSNWSYELFPLDTLSIVMTPASSTSDLSCSLSFRELQ